MRRSRSPIEIAVLLFGNGMAGLVLLVSSLLREMHEFWLNSGGYPVFLRAMVLHLHYPLFFLVFGSTAAVSLMSLRYFAEDRRAGRGLLLMCGLQWLLFTAIVVIMLWNNVENLLNGHPLHYHGDQ
jgi:hypothetical protein